MSDDRLWMSVKRRTLNHHRVEAGAIRTGCDLYIGVDGHGESGRGIVIDAGMAAALESRPCPRCWPPTVPRWPHRPVQVVELPDAVELDTVNGQHITGPGVVETGRKWTLTLLAPCEWITKNKVNDQWDRYKVAKLTKQWRQAMVSACANGRLPRGDTRLDHIRIEAEARFRGRAAVRDRNNLEPTLSAIQDGLTPAKVLTRKGRKIQVPGWGLIPDDSDKHVELSRIWVGDPLPKTVIAEHPGLLIVTITELVPAGALF